MGKQKESVSDAIARLIRERREREDFLDDEENSKYLVDPIICNGKGSIIKTPINERKIEENAM